MLEVKLGALFGIEQQLGDMDAVWQHLKKKQMEKAFGAWTKPDKPCASPPDVFSGRHALPSPD